MMTVAVFSINCPKLLAQAVVVKVGSLATIIAAVVGLVTLTSPLSQRAVWCLPPHLLQFRADVQSFSACLSPKQLTHLFKSKIIFFLSVSPVGHFVGQ
jgi:hypothetical protein